jgi:tRNA G18 (ribose-2'-O)-methylase SpoU
MKKIENADLDRISIEEFKTIKKLPITIILDDIRSLHNVGSVFRTSDAFLINEIILCGITASPPNKEIHKTALGATETVNWQYHASIIEVIQQLKEKNYKIFAVEQVENSIKLNDFKLNQQVNYALIFGNEVKGVAQEAINLCDGAIEIPQLGTKHSLNIAVSCGVVVWDLFQKYLKTNRI